MLNHVIHLFDICESSKLHSESHRMCGLPFLNDNVPEKKSCPVRNSCLARSTMVSIPSFGFNHLLSSLFGNIKKNRSSYNEFHRYLLPPVNFTENQFLSFPLWHRRKRAQMAKSDVTFNFGPKIHYTADHVVSEIPNARRRKENVANVENSTAYSFKIRL